MLQYNKSVPNTVIYHANCDDGFCAAMVAWLYLRDNANYIPCAYGEFPKMEDIEGKNLFIVDFSFPLTAMLQYQEAARRLVVLDHHKTAKEALASMPQRMSRDDHIEFDMDRSGAMMTWDFFFRGLNPSMLISHVQDNDLWKRELHKTVPFIRRLRSFPYDFQLWEGLHVMTLRNSESNAYRSFVREGEAIEEFVANQVKYISGMGKHWLRLDGPGGGVAGLACCTNKTFASEIGHALVLESKSFGACYFVRSDGQVEFSLRSTDEFMDVSAIAKKYGGGGHRNAAGFVVKRDLFDDMLHRDLRTA